MGGTEGRDGEVGVKGQLYLNIGLHNGVLLRTVVDQVIIIFFQVCLYLTINIMSVFYQFYQGAKNLVQNFIMTFSYFLFVDLTTLRTFFNFYLLVH